jgi:acid phosphatase family membrane protein YuiD
LSEKELINSKNEIFYSKFKTSLGHQWFEVIGGIAIGSLAGFICYLLAF